jgi:hypothetical protein
MLFPLGQAFQALRNRDLKSQQNITSSHDTNAVLLLDDLKLTQDMIGMVMVLYNKHPLRRV